MDASEVRPTVMNQKPRPRGPLRFWASRRSGHRSRGQTLVEFALVFPIFILLMAGIADFGFGLYQYMNVINAARIGARFGITSPSNAPGIANAAQASGVSSASVVTACWSVLANGGATTPTSAPPTTTPGANQAGWEDCTSTGTVGGKSAKPTTGDTIAVYVSLPYGYLWPINLHAGVVNVSLFTTPINLASTLQMKIE